MIRYYRDMAGISQKGLAELVGITPAYLCQLESGTRKNPSASVYLRIAQALKVSPQQLVRSNQRKGNRIMKFRPAAEVKLEDIIGSYELLDYTDYENAKTYNINQMANTGLPLWVMSLTIRADTTTRLTICSKEGQIVNRETVAVETGPTYYVDDNHILVYEALLVLATDDGLYRFYSKDNPCWHVHERV